jgi:hypothetical protein
VDLATSGRDGFGTMTLPRRNLKEIMDVLLTLSQSYSDIDENPNELIQIKNEIVENITKLGELIGERVTSTSCRIAGLNESMDSD